MNEPNLQTILKAGTFGTDPAELAACVTANPILAPSQLPSRIVCPGNADELQAVIHWANQTGANLTVTSSTGAHCKGGIDNPTEHTRIDLSRWKKIDLIGRRNRVCRIEPGVTYGELTAALQEHGMTLPIPLAPRDGKSVLAATMDREPTTWCNKQWDSSDPVASTEFFFGTGEQFRTGAGGGPGTIEQQRASGGALKFSSGPSQTDFHRVVQGAQGTMGIVTWITLRTELKPSVQKPMLVGAERLEDLLPFVYVVQRGLLGEETCILDRTAAAMLMAYDQVSAFESLRATLPAYVCLQNIAGFDRLPQARLDYHHQDIAQFAQQFNLQLESRIGNLAADDLLMRATHPCGAIDWRHALRGHCLSIFFTSTLDRMPAFRQCFIDVAAEFGIAETDIGMYLQPMVQNHSCHAEWMIPFDPGSADQVTQMKQIERQATMRLIQAGAFFSRPYGTAGELVWAQNPANYQLVKTIKGLFDPNHVLQRGKWNL